MMIWKITEQQTDFIRNGLEITVNRAYDKTTWPKKKKKNHTGDLTLPLVPSVLFLSIILLLFKQLVI